MVSSAHNVCPRGYYVAIVSTIAESSANHHLELQPGFDRLGQIEEKFMGPPIPLYAPVDSGEKDNIFISKSYDATSHFETTTGKLGSRYCLFYDLLVLTFSYRRYSRHLQKS
jgi:Rab GDP dissociation inhibitor